MEGRTSTPVKVVFGEENRSQLWNNAYDIPPWTTHLALRAVYTVILQVQYQPLLSHTPLNTPDAWHVCVYGNNPRNCNLKAQVFSIQYITNLKQKRSNLFTNQPWTLHHAGVLFNQGGNKETRQACHTRQLPSIPGVPCLHFFFFLHIANTGGEKSLGTSTMRVTQQGCYTNKLICCPTCS